MDEKNFTGYPLYLQLICTLPDANIDYDYVKFNVKLVNKLDCSWKHWLQINDIKEIIKIRWYKKRSTSSGFRI
jgi:hypothetical protein